MLQVLQDGSHSQPHKWQKMLFMYVASSGETVFSDASQRGDFSKGLQNKVLDPLVIPAANRP